MKIAIIGATGNMGTRLTKEATARGHQVTAVSRNADKLESLEGAAASHCVDLHDEAKLADAMKGADATILSVSFIGNDVRPVVAAVKRAGVGRLAIVGGASSLLNADGVRLLDQPDYPEFIKLEATPAAAALDWLRAGVKTDMDWVYVSPSMMLTAGERTGKFRLGKDHLLTAEDGKSGISYEDLSVAIIDELETPKHHSERFTVGY